MARRLPTIAEVAKEAGVPLRTMRRRLAALDAQSGGKVLVKGRPTRVRRSALAGFLEGGDDEGDAFEALRTRAVEGRKELRALAARVRDVEAKSGG